jgi:hypothetical protein
LRPRLCLTGAFICTDNWLVSKKFGRTFNLLHNNQHKFTVRKKQACWLAANTEDFMKSYEVQSFKWLPNGNLDVIFRKKDFFAGASPDLTIEEIDLVSFRKKFGFSPRKQKPPKA